MFRWSKPSRSCRVERGENLIPRCCRRSISCSIDKVSSFWLLDCCGCCCPAWRGVLVDGCLSVTVVGWFERSGWRESLCWGRFRRWLERVKPLSLLVPYKVDDDAITWSFFPKVLCRGNLHKLFSLSKQCEIRLVSITGAPLKGSTVIGTNETTTKIP